MMRVDFCSQAAMTFAVGAWWHHDGRHTLPKSRLNRFGVWEDGEFVGVIVFGCGANKDLFAPYGLDQFQGAELLRIALRENRVSSVSAVIGASVRLLHKYSPGLRLLVSFANPDDRHIGVVYQASNWIHDGMSNPTPEFIVHGELIHCRAAYKMREAHPMGGVVTKNMVDWLRMFIDPAAITNLCVSKYRYVYPLDRAMRRQLLPLARPFPKVRPNAT